VGELQTFVELAGNLTPVTAIALVLGLLIVGKLRTEREVKEAKENADQRVAEAQESVKRAWAERDKVLEQLTQNNEATARMVASFGELRAVIDTLVRDRTRG
jgi:F0F1-type ATP synthase membrane subunit b/b'